MGYTYGFNAGLIRSENRYFIPEQEWNSAEKLNPGKYLREEKGDSSSACFEYAGQKKVYHNIGYNWGYLHGSEVRADMKSQVSEREFELTMSAFAKSVRILYLQINEDSYLQCVTELKPDEEKGMRIELFNYFLQKSSEPETDRSALDNIKKLIAENKVQQAIDHSTNHFREQKNIMGFDVALSLKSRLMDIRKANKMDDITEEVYIDTQTEILNNLTFFIERAS